MKDELNSRRLPRRRKLRRQAAAITGLSSEREGDVLQLYLRLASLADLSASPVEAVCRTPWLAQHLACPNDNVLDRSGEDPDDVERAQMNISNH